MTSLSANQILVLYTWFPLTALLLFLLLIGRFYQKFSGRQTYFRLFLVPLALLGAAAVRHASVGLPVGDLLGDLLSVAGGLVLIFISIFLLWRMTTGRK